MPITMNTTCVECFLRKRLDQARKLGNDAQATQVCKQIMRQFADAPDTMDSAVFGNICDEIMCDFFGIDPDGMRKEKELSNRFVLDRLDSIRSRIEKAEDPIYAALQFAVLGNYLDFSALYGQVSFEDLEKMLDTATEMDLDKTQYARFLADLKSARHFLYITDNAGEICFDRLLAECLSRAYPQLEITFCVRGKPVSNDATREDALLAGIPFPIIDSGSGVGGTSLPLVNEQTRQAVAQADVILAKGMGNTESMYGCGYNVYYAFLVKCARFMEFFQAPKMKPMFIRDKQA